MNEERILNRAIDILKGEVQSLKDKLGYNVNLVRDLYIQKSELLKKEEALIKDKDDLLRQINRQNDEIEGLKDEIAYKKNTIELLNVSRNNLMEDFNISQEEVAKLRKLLKEEEDKKYQAISIRDRHIEALEAEKEKVAPYSKATIKTYLKFWRGEDARICKEYTPEEYKKFLDRRLGLAVSVLFSITEELTK